MDMFLNIAAKRAQLQAFCDVVLGGRPAVGIGASLGAAVLTDLAAAAPATLAKAVLLDPQSFIEGTPEIPGGELGARAGIRVLSSWPLRWAANQLAYSDKGAMATDDAIRVGLLHCGRNGWEDDQVEWLRGDGYAVADLVRPTFAEMEGVLRMTCHEDAAGLLLLLEQAHTVPSATAPVAMSAPLDELEPLKSFDDQPGGDANRRNKRVYHL